MHPILLSEFVSELCEINENHTSTMLEYYVELQTGGSKILPSKEVQALSFFIRRSRSGLMFPASFSNCLDSKYLGLGVKIKILLLWLAESMAFLFSLLWHGTKPSLLV